MDAGAVYDCGQFIWCLMGREWLEYHLVMSHIYRLQLSDVMQYKILWVFEFWFSTDPVKYISNVWICMLTVFHFLFFINKLYVILLKIHLSSPLLSSACF